MAKKMLNPNTTLWVVDADLVTDPLLIGTTVLNAAPALNFSCAVTRGYNINPTDSDTDDTASICDSGNVANRLFDNYEGEVTIFRDGDVADTSSIFNKTFNYFKEPDKRFWIFRRLGKKNTEPAVATDEIEGFLFTNDRIRSIDGGDSGPIQATIPLLAQGSYTGYYYLGGTGPVAGVPKVTAATPSGAAAGATVTLTGTNLTGATSAKVGAVAATSVTATSATTATLVVPAGSAGSAPITVTTPSGTSAPFAYTRGA